MLQGILGSNLKQGYGRGVLWRRVLAAVRVHIILSRICGGVLGAKRPRVGRDRIEFPECRRGTGNNGGVEGRKGNHWRRGRQRRGFPRVVEVIHRGKQSISRCVKQGRACNFLDNNEPRGVCQICTSRAGGQRGQICMNFNRSGQLVHCI